MVFVVEVLVDGLVGVAVVVWPRLEAVKLIFFRMIPLSLAILFISLTVFA